MGQCGESCNDDSQCPVAAQDPGQSICVSGACVECRADPDCKGATPACVNNSCVQCRAAADCPVVAPVCDANMCRACKLDADCPSNACDVDSGQCVAETQIRYASPTGLDTNDCSIAAPCTPTQAYNTVDAGHPWLRMLPGMYMSPQVTVTGKAVRIIATGATMSSTSGSATSISIGPNGSASIRGLAVYLGPSSTSSSGLLCVPTSGSGVLILEDVTITIDNSGPTVAALAVGPNCMLTLARSSLTGATQLQENSTSVIDRGRFAGHFEVMTNHATAGISVVVTNSVFVDTNFAPSLGSTASGQSINIENSTFYSSTTSLAGACAFSTLPATAMTLTNNIFYAPNAPNALRIDSSCTADTNVAYPQTTNSAGANAIVLDPKLVDAVIGDFHLQAGSPAIDAAKTTATPPTEDFDGTMRPQGARNDIGAFEFKP
jgi:hypothetical protein